MPNDIGNDVQLTANKLENIKPISAENADQAAQQALASNDRHLDLNSTTWNGMRSGAIMYDSTQTQDWLSVVPKKYKELGEQWQQRNGVIKITPIQQRQKFTYSTVAYIAAKQEEPKTQIMPISNLQVTPHQITWDFYDTTEGRVGVSNAVEKHMICEFDVYITELVASYWFFGEDNQYLFGKEIVDTLKSHWKEAINKHSCVQIDALCTEVEDTRWFADFRNSFLQQHQGWVCRFTSHAFGVFQGVINEVNFEIEDGSTSSKFHIKIEEAIFLNDAYSLDGKKPESTTSDGSTTNSGNATDTENIGTGE